MSRNYEKKFIESFSNEEILLVSDKPFHYVSGGVGPYYIDLRRGPNNPQIYNTFLDKYSEMIKGKTDNLLFVGVPTTGVVYATGLALRYNSSLAVMEKLNPERVHIFSSEVLKKEIDILASVVKSKKNDFAFLGLEDMGVMLATGLGLKYNKPSAIMRRVQKGHGTSKTIEANLEHFLNQGITQLYIINDPYNPQPENEIIATLNTIHGIKNFKFSIITRSPPPEINIKDNSLRVIEIEDLWTTGTSAINLHRNIKKVLGLNSEVLVFLDREQNAMKKFDKLKINAKSVYKITYIANYLLEKKLINQEIYYKVMNYVNQFNKKSFTEKLVELNDSSVCVGIDITPGKFPDKPEDTTLPNYPYETNAKGIKQYCVDLLNEIAKVPNVKVIKPNLAYYNDLKNQEMYSIISTIYEKAKELNLLVILDTKIGDIMRTQSQYAEKYKHFDAVTAHGFMGSDSIFPITDTQLGCYVLAFTSNPSRIDLETQPLLSEDVLDKYQKLILDGIPENEAKKCIFDEAKKVYQLMAEHIVDWQYAGSVGAVIGGTPNKEGKLEELEDIIHIFAKKLDYLPPILIPGVGTQGGSATDVINAILNVLSSFDWSEYKIRHELRKVVINSSSAIDYSPRPKDAAQDLVNEIKNTIDFFFQKNQNN